MREFFVTTIAVLLVVVSQLHLPLKVYPASLMVSRQPQVAADSPLQELRNIIFDVNETLSRFKEEKFVLVLRFTQTSYKPDSQVIITKFEDGHTEVEIKELLKTLATYLPDNFPQGSPTPEQLRAIARVIPVKRTLLKKVPDNVEQLLVQFGDLKLSSLRNEGLPLDGTRYDLWYAVPTQTLRVTQYGPTVGSASAKDQPVKWMNDVYKAVRGPDSARLKTVTELAFTYGKPQNPVPLRSNFNECRVDGIDLPCGLH